MAFIGGDCYSGLRALFRAGREYEKNRRAIEGFRVESHIGEAAPVKQGEPLDFLGIAGAVGFAVDVNTVKGDPLPPSRFVTVAELAEHLESAFNAGVAHGERKQAAELERANARRDDYESALQSQKERAGFLEKELAEARATIEAWRPVVESTVLWRSAGRDWVTGRMAQLRRAVDALPDAMRPK